MAVTRSVGFGCFLDGIRAPCPFSGGVRVRICQALWDPTQDSTREPVPGESMCRCSSVEGHPTTGNRPWPPCGSVGPFPVRVVRLNHHIEKAPHGANRDVRGFLRSVSRSLSARAHWPFLLLVDSFGSLWHRIRPGGLLGARRSVRRASIRLARGRPFRSSGGRRRRFLAALTSGPNRRNVWCPRRCRWRSHCS